MLNILHVAQTGLRASQTQVEGVMNNLANENTEGYKKRVVDVSELTHVNSHLAGRGVFVDGISRQTDIYMYQNVVKEEAKLNNLSELDMMLGDIESIFMETDTSGLSADLNRYFTSIENLRTSPDNPIYKNDLTNNGNIIVTDLQSLYSDIEQKETSTLDKSKSVVDEINNILKDIGNISQRILESTGDTPNDLLDKRDLLEKQLATYIDVDITREDSYSVKIGGRTAVSFGTNVHTLNLVEKYTPQQDVYTKLNADGVTKTPYESNIVETTWGIPIAEIQTLQLSGAVDDGSGDAAGTAKTVHFLGESIADAKMGDDAATLAGKIENDKTDIISTWNSQTGNEKRQISDIVDAGSGKLTITYKVIDSGGNTLTGLDANIPIIEDSSSVGMICADSIETTEGTGQDSLTYSLNNKYNITVTNGEVIKDSSGNAVDLDGDGDNTNDAITKDNIVLALVYKINKDSETGGLITAYNGKYELAEDGSKILTNDSRHSLYDSINPNKDRYLFVESDINGEAGTFVGEINVKDNDNTDIDTKSDTYGSYIGKSISKDALASKDGMNDIHLEILEKELYTTGGIINPMIDNLKTDSGKNDFNVYKDMLDAFALKLSDYSSAFIEASDGTYTSGLDASQLDGNNSITTNVGLFNGADVKSLKFNDNIANTLTQQKLDYLATMQWNKDINFDSTGLNNTSFAKYYQTLRVDIADTRENTIFSLESQSAVTESLNNTYDKLTKVDKDAEMIDLIKYQSAYEANAKVITVIDEMLSTLLNIKR